MPSCWICLDDEADQCSKPPVRDCSCRGDDAGFAHLSCLVDYARRKSIDNADDPREFTRPWSYCPTCKQYYQNQLQLDLSDELKRFVDEQYPECGWRHLDVQVVMLGTIAKGTQKSKERRDEIIETSLSVIHQLSMQPDSTICLHIIDLMKACALKLIGGATLDGEDLTEDDAKKGTQYLYDSRRISEAIGDENGLEIAIATEAQIAKCKAKCIKKFGAQEAFGKPETQEQVLESVRASYQLGVEKNGEVSSLMQGSHLANQLRNSRRTIEAWRLLKRLIGISKQHPAQSTRPRKTLNNYCYDARLELLHC